MTAPQSRTSAGGRGIPIPLDAAQGAQPPLSADGTAPTPADGREASVAPKADASPNFSATMGHLICTRSPAHARYANRTLNPDLVEEDASRFDLGNVVHALLLQGEDLAYVIHGFDDWKKKEAREARDEARAEGRIPMLAAQREEVRAMLEAVAAQLEQHEAAPPLFSDGEPEHTLEWDEDGTACKARLDWLRHDALTVDDLKTRGQEGGANPDAWKRGLYSHGAHLQAFMYVRAVEKLTGVTPTFRWCLVESKPPFALSVVEPDASVLACGEADFWFALGVWRECMASGVWPAYDPTVTRVEAPSWELDRRVAREEWAA